VFPNPRIYKKYVVLAKTVIETLAYILDYHCCVSLILLFHKYSSYSRARKGSDTHHPSPIYKYLKFKHNFDALEYRVPSTSNGLANDEL